MGICAIFTYNTFLIIEEFMINSILTSLTVMHFSCDCIKTYDLDSGMIEF